jgi:hydrogenase maturation protein HypF
MDVIATTISLSRKMPPVLGVGAFLKNAVCLIQGDEAWVSRDNGSLDSVAAVEGFEGTIHEMLAMAKEKPVAVAHDWHPDFASTTWAVAFAEQMPPPHPASLKLRRTGGGGDPPPNLPPRGEEVLSRIGVQHHHAHIAAVMAEHGIEGPVLGLALDGFGLGSNNEAWGGELLRVDAAGFERLGHLHPLPQPGGDLAARQTWRMGAAALWAMGRGDEIASRYKDFANAGVLTSMMERGINCPMTTSAGRLFDAACGLLGVKPMAAFEGEAPMALEGMVGETKVYSGGWGIGERELQSSSQPLPPPPNLPLKGGGIPCAPDVVPRSLLVLDMRPLLERLLGCETREGAELFHGTLIEALCAWALKAAELTGIHTVAFGGGCFFNKVLREGLCQRMMISGLAPLLPKQMSFGDPAISLGQAWAAALRLNVGGLS